MSGELFDVGTVASLSPKLRWIEKHGIFLHSPDSELVGKEDDDGDVIFAYYATSTAVGHEDTHKVGRGMTADEALADYAIKHGLRLWFECDIPKEA